MGITAGPDGSLWFTELASSKIGKITLEGTISESAIPSKSGADAIALGPDGDLWFTESRDLPGGSSIGKITPDGTITEYPFSTTANNPNGPDGIVAGPDGNMWFTDRTASKIGKITMGGIITEYGPTSAMPISISTGPGGNMFFTETCVCGGAFYSKIGKITPGGTITEFAVFHADLRRGGITAGPDGNLWFTEPYPGGISKITVNGTMTEYHGGTVGCCIVAGSDGNLWFTDNIGLGRITPGGIIEYPTGFAAGIAIGPDGNVWFTEPNANKIGKFTP